MLNQQLAYTMTVSHHDHQGNRLNKVTLTISYSTALTLYCFVFRNYVSPTWTHN